MTKKSDLFKGKKARQIAIDAINSSKPRLQSEEESGWVQGYVDLGEVEINHLRQRWFAEVPGSMAPDHVLIGAIQATENKGYNVDEVEKLIVPTQIAYETNDDATFLKNYALIFKLLSEAPKNLESDYWNYTQYDDFEQYKGKVKFPPREVFTMDENQLLSKLHAAWSAQIAGGAIGTMLEGYTTDNIRERFGEVTEYLRQPSTHNDDILFELAFIDAAMKNGKNLTADDIALEWIANIAYTWSAEEIAMLNLKRGIFPPESAKLNNPWNEWIGAQMRGAVCGLVAPGNPEYAAYLAWMDGSISHINNGIIGEVFNAMLVSMAWTDPSIRSILKKSIDLLPDDSEYYSVVKFAYDKCLEYDQWEPAWRECEEKYRRYNWIHAYPNAAAEVIALYYAEEDFDKCMNIISMCGQDVDCNAGQIGTLYGVIHGFGGIDDKWLEPFNDEFVSLYRGYEKTTISYIAENTYKAYKILNA